MDSVNYLHSFLYFSYIYSYILCFSFVSYIFIGFKFLYIIHLIFFKYTLRVFSTCNIFSSSLLLYIHFTPFCRFYHLLNCFIYYNTYTFFLYVMLRESYMLLLCSFVYMDNNIMRSEI